MPQPAAGAPEVSMAAFQRDFVAALFAPPSQCAPSMAQLASQPAFAVYRNTVMKGCIDALEANFPTVARLVGTEWFRATAALYVASDPPTDAALQRYGGGFAAFLQHFAPAAGLVYLPGVAALDTLWRQAHGAADAKAVDPAWVSGHSVDAVGALVLRPHPAARWAWFDAQPIYSIWERNRRLDDTAAELRWQGEGALLTRPHDTVTWQPLDQAGCAFLDACAAGHTLAQASEQALAVAEMPGRASQAAPWTDIATLFARLLRAGALVSEPTQPAPH